MRRDGQDRANHGGRVRSKQVAPGRRQWIRAGRQNRTMGRGAERVAAPAWASAGLAAAEAAGAWSSAADRREEPAVTPEKRAREAAAVQMRGRRAAGRRPASAAAAAARRLGVVPASEAVEVRASLRVAEAGRSRRASERAWVAARARTWPAAWSRVGAGVEVGGAGARAPRQASRATPRRPGRTATLARETPAG